jgi:hypothetical protein
MPLLISRMPGRLVLHDRRARITNRESAATLTVNHKGAAAHAGAAAYLASQTLTNVVMVPRGEYQQTSIVNSLSCPTFTNRPIESQWIFLRLSHRRYNATQQ